MIVALGFLLLLLLLLLLVVVVVLVVVSLHTRCALGDVHSCFAGIIEHCQSFSVLGHS